MDAGVGVHQLARFVAQAVDVVAVEVAQHHVVDVGGLFKLVLMDGQLGDGVG